MKNRFHSSGTASGIVETMKRWNANMPTSASRVSVRSVEKRRTRGIPASSTVPGPCAMNDANFDGRMSVGWLR